MNNKPRYLSKSTFKIGIECPTKLNYLKKAEYGNTKNDNDFLKALAQGGFQVGELAKVYYPGGVSIDTLDYEEAIRLTEEALKKDQVIIYEAAFRFNDSFVRVDILRKNGTRVDLLEVKAKSYSGSDTSGFWTEKDTISKTWESYLLDVTYQRWVLSKAHPELIVTPYLMLVDKAAKAGVDGINQRFFLISDPKDPSRRVRVAPGTTAQSLETKLLVELNVDREVDFLLEQKYEDRSFDEHVNYLADHYKRDIRIKPTLSRDCKTCEYRMPRGAEGEWQKNGFEECFIEAADLKAKDFARPFVFDIWRLHFLKKDGFLKEGRYFQDELTPDDLAPKTKKKKDDSDREPGLANLDRQWLQVELSRKSKSKPYLDVAGLSDVFASFEYPLHFIDFETTRVAIPFHQGRRPYEQIAFQFSHHVVHKDGRIEHKDQFLSFEKGKFPNYDFVRALKTSLEGDQGTIFRYAEHENTVLREIQTQLRHDPAPPADAEALCEWIDTVTREKTDNKGGERRGRRCMVDLKDLVQKYFYHPATHGSNSLKAVLPAVLGESRVIQQRYSKPVYGVRDGISSLNFVNHTWVKFKGDGKVIDPYKALDPVFTDIELPSESLYEEDERIAEGGAAMTAYTRMQFTEMPEGERERVRAALLRYCELDTFAMVLLFEYWKNAIADGVEEEDVA